MAIHDPIGDMLTTLRNGVRAGHPRVNIRRSKLHVAILKILKREHYIYDYKASEGDVQAMIRVYLRPPATVKDARVRKITKIARVSRPGLRNYTTSVHMPRILNGLGICVVSTSKGVMSGAEARKSRVGGEILLKVW